MHREDIRWIQRFQNYKKALTQLEKAVQQGSYNDLERQGLIKVFEFTYELAWNTLRDLLREQGYSLLTGSKDAIRKAFEVGLLQDGSNWLKMIESRNLSSHTYEEQTAEELLEIIRALYFPLMKKLSERLEKEINK